MATDPVLISRPVACRLLGMTARRFARLEASGVFVAAEPGRGQRGAQYDGAAVVTAFVRHTLTTHGASAEAPRDRRDRSQAELNELRLARERGVLLPRQQVVDEGTAYIARVQGRLRALAPRLRQELGVEEAVAVRVAELVEEAIGEMHQWRTSVAFLASEADA